MEYNPEGGGLSRLALQERGGGVLQRPDQESSIKPPMEPAEPWNVCGLLREEDGLGAGLLRGEAHGHSGGVAGQELRPRPGNTLGDPQEEDQVRREYVRGPVDVTRQHFTGVIYSLCLIHYFL